MKRTKIQKLTISKQTLRVLQASERQLAAGGLPKSYILQAGCPGGDLTENKNSLCLPLGSCVGAC